MELNSVDFFILFFCLDTKEPKNQGFGCLGEKGKALA